MLYERERYFRRLLNFGGTVLRLFFRLSQKSLQPRRMRSVMSWMAWEGMSFQNA
jgi:hypothetical protein